MDTNSKPAFMPALTSGLLLGVVLVIYSLILYVAGLNENTYVALLSYVILAVGLYLIIVNFRNKYQNGFLSYGKGVGVGTLTGFFAAIILGIFTYVYISYIDPGIIEEILAKSEESILERNPNISDEDLDVALSMVEKFTNPVMMLATTIVWYTIASLIFSLIISIFAKQEDNNIA